MASIRTLQESTPIRVDDLLLQASRAEAARTFARPWLGRKRVAFVPVFRQRAAPPDQIPPDWENVILRRVTYDPRREANGADRSLRGYNPGDNTQHVIYRSADGKLHELWHFLGKTAVHHEDLTAAYGAPPAVDRPVYYATARTPNQHVAYRGTNGHIYELLW